MNINDINFNNPYTIIDALESECQVIVPDKMMELVKYCEGKISKSKKSQFIENVCVPFVERVLRIALDITEHGGYGHVDTQFMKSYKSRELAFYNKMKGTNTPYKRFTYDEFGGCKIIDWSADDFISSVLYNLHVTSCFQREYGIKYKFNGFKTKPVMTESVLASIQMVEHAKTLPNVELPPEYVKIVKKYTPEHILMLLMVVHTLAIEVSFQIEYTRAHHTDVEKRIPIDNNYTTPEDSINVAEIKKIAQTLTYGELRTICGWFNNVAYERVRKVDNIIYLSKL